MINIPAVPLLRYSGPFLKWTREELKKMDERTKKLMTLHKALYPRDIQYVSRKERRGGLSVDASIQQLKDYIEKRGGRLITVTINNTDNTRFNRTNVIRKQKWEEKQQYGHFKRQTSEISHEETWTGLRKGNRKRETESLLIAAQNIAIRTNHIK